MADGAISFIGDHTVRFAYTLTNADPNGTPIGPNHSDYVDRSVRVFGTFGGATVAIQGSEAADAFANPFTLDDPQGVDLSFAAAGGKSISEVPELTRPSLSGGAGSTLTVVITARRSRAGRGM